MTDEKRDDSEAIEDLPETTGESVSSADQANVKGGDLGALPRVNVTLNAQPLKPSVGAGQTSTAGIMLTMGQMLTMG